MRYRYEPGSNTAGLKSVWMLWLVDDRWGEGELDFAEYDNAAGRTSVSANLHRACSSTPCAVDSGSRSVDPTVWHTATLIWSAGVVHAYTDGQLLATSTVQVPTTPMHLQLQTEASDYGPTAAPTAETDIDVDWVTQYQIK